MSTLDGRLSALPLLIFLRKSTSKVNAMTCFHVYAINFFKLFQAETLRRLLVEDQTKQKVGRLN